MSTNAPFLSSGTSILPADLSRAQRGWLVAAAVLVHALIAVTALTWAVTPVQIAEPPSIEVALINDEPMVSPVVPTPVPEQPKKAPVVTPPAPAVHKPQPVAPPILASTKPAQANEMQAPPPVPVADPKPAVEAAPATPAVANPAPATNQVAAAAQPPAQPVVLPSSALRYLVKPKLNYPRVSRELGESGAVKLRLEIDAQGHLNGNVTVVQSSGFPRLDLEAVRAMKEARFQPRIVDGVPRAVSAVTSLEFNLEEQ